MNIVNEIRLSKSCIGMAEKIAVNRVLDRGFFGMGQEVKAFETALSDFFGRPAVCVVNGTAALHLALQCAGVSRGDEVLVQSLTYVASFQAICATGATPVSCDVSPDTIGIDLRDAEKKITPRTRAIMPVHYAGGVGDLESIYAFAKLHDLRVIEDAAHAFGTVYNGSKIGSTGDVSCFSFDGIKNITSGEGGCIVTNDLALLDQVRDARLLGVVRDSEKRFSGERTWNPDVIGQGWRYHMSDLMAAIGRAQLENFYFHKDRRQELAKYYVSRLEGIASISIFEHDYNEVVPHIFVIKIISGANRDGVITFLRENGITAGVHYKPNHLLTYFVQSARGRLPVTEDLYPKLITLPLHPELCIEEIDFIVKVLNEGLQALE